MTSVREKIVFENKNECIGTKILGFFEASEFWCEEQTKRFFLGVFSCTPSNILIETLLTGMQFVVEEIYEFENSVM